MEFTIDPKTNKARLTFTAELELGRCLEVERIEIWHVVSSPSIISCTDEASAAEIKKRLDDGARAAGRAPDATLVRRTDLDITRRFVPDAGIIEHVKREAALAFQTDLATASVAIPPVT